VLWEYRDLNAARRKRIPAPLWPFWAPDPDEYYRWRIQLDCGCITEVLTCGPDRRPDDTRWPDPVCGARLPAGQLLCTHKDSSPAPYREIAGWGDRREVTFPADPAEPPEWADADTWALLRHDEPVTSAFWTVTLSCGHVTEVPVSDLGWKPADGLSRVSVGRLLEMTTEFEELWAEQPDAHRHASASTRKGCSLRAGRARAPSICATPARGRGPSSRASASAGSSRARRSRHRPSRLPGPAWSSGCGRPRPRPTNCDASSPSWTRLRGSSVTAYQTQRGKADITGDPADN
jgi:hypothetical protein